MKTAFALLALLALLAAVLLFVALSWAGMPSGVTMWTHGNFR